MPSKKFRKYDLVQRLLFPLLALAMLTTCKSPLLSIVLEEVGEAVTRPVISAIYPTDDSSEVPVNAQLSITFSKSIDLATVKDTTLMIRDETGSTVAGRYSVDGATVTFTATGGFGFGKTYTVTVTAGLLDTDGNPLPEEYSWNFVTSLTPDVTAPSINALTFESASLALVDSTKWSGSLGVEVTVNATDNRAIAQIMLSGDASLSGATWVTFNASSPIYTVNFLAPGGLKHVYAQVKDGAGNVSTITMSEDIRIDLTAPEITNFLINNGASATNSNAIDIDIFSIDGEASSGLAQFRYRLVSGDWQPWQDLEIDSGAGLGSVDSITIATGLGEPAVLEAQVMDAVGHTSAIEQRAILYEQTPPTIVDVSWDNASVFPYNGSLLRIIFDEEMNPDSFSETSFTLVKVSDASPVPGMINLTTGNSIQNAAAELWGLELAPNTSYKVALANTVYDIAGNSIGGSDKLWFFSTGDAVDSSPPAGTVTLADPDGAGQLQVVILPAGSTATDSATVVLDFSAINDDYNIPYGIKLWGDNDGLQVNEKSFEQDASWIPWPGSNQVTWHLSTSSGTKYILYKLMDSAGNESSSPVQLKLVLDNAQAPVIYGVSIDEGSTHTNDADRKVDLSIQAEDVHSGIKEMIVSNSAAFTGAVWQAWSPVIQEWQLPDADGPYSFYVKVRDYLDEESATNSGSGITLDRSAPSIRFNVTQLLVSTETALLEGSAGSDIYDLTEAYGVKSYLWEKLSGPGSLYFNATSGAGTSNSGTGSQEPYASASTEGDYFIKITIIDNAGNSSYATVPFTWDITDPGDISGLAVNQYNTTGQPTWSWTGVANADFYRTSYEPDFSPFIDVFSTSFTPNAPLTPDGNKTLYVRAQDNAGNSSVELNATVRVDTTPPTITVTHPSFIANAASPMVTIDFSFATHFDGSITDGGTNPSGIKSYEWSKSGTIGSGALNFGTPAAATTTVSATENDSYQIRLRVEDYAGNVTDAYLSLLRDITPPSAPTVTGLALTPNRQPTWYWSSNGGGIGTFQYRLVNTSDSIVVEDWTTTTSTSYKPAGLLPDVKNYTISVREFDAANNTSAAGSFVTLVDTSQTTPAQITIGDAYPALRNVTSMEWDLLTGSGGIATNYRYYFDGSGTWTYGGAGLDEGTPTSITRSSLANGNHSITVEEYFNSQWHSELSATHTITVDTIAPAIPVLTGTGLNTTTTDRTATPDTTPTWTWVSGGGGNGKYRYQLTRVYAANGSASGAVIQAWTTETTATSYTAPAQTDGTYRLDVQERDDAANWSPIKSQLTTIDTVYPTLTSVLIRGTSHPTDTDYTYTRATSVNVDIAADISGDYNIAYNRDVLISIYDYNPAAWENHSVYPEASAANSRTISTTFTTTNGSQYVYIRLIDEAGNTTSSKYDSIILDTVLPTGTFTINNGAATTPSSSYYLTLSASDNISSASELEVSLYDYNTGAWGAYRTYASTMLSDSTLTPSAGSKSAHVQIRDAAGNNLFYLSDSITLEVPVPTYASKGQYSGGYTYVYYSPVTDPAGGSYITRYNIYSTSDPSADPNNGDPVTYLYNTTSTSYSYAPIPKGELLYFFVRAYDTDTGGYGPYSATSVLGFSSNVTVVYDAGLDKGEFYADTSRATMLKSLLEDAQGIVADAYVEGVMPTWTVTLLPEELISSTYSTGGMIYGDPVIITPGSSFSTASTIDGRVRNIAAAGKGTLAMGLGGAYYLYRVDQNWAAWSLSSVSPIQPSDIDSGNQMLLTASQSAKTAIAATSESIWYTPLYYTTLYNSYQGSSIAANIFSTNVSRRGVYFPGTIPAGTYIYAGDTYGTTHFPVVRQGEYCYFGYYEVPDVVRTGQVFFINLVARMDDF